MYSFTSLSRMLLTAIGAFVFVMFFSVQFASAQFTATGTDTGLEGGSNDRSFSIGDWVETTDILKVRNAAGVLLGTQPAFALGRIISGPRTAQGYAYWEIDFQSGFDGWSAAPWLRLSDQRSGGGGGSSSRSDSSESESGGMDRNALVALINQLMAQIAALQAEVGQPMTDAGDHDTDVLDNPYDSMGDTQNGIFFDLDYYDFVTGHRAGSNDAPIGELTIESKEGKIKVEDIFLQLTQLTRGLGNNDFEDFSLWYEGDKIAEVDSSKIFNGVIRLPLGNGLIVETGEEIEIAIGASIATSAPSGTWDISVVEISYYSFDEERVASIGDEDDRVRFLVRAEAGEGSLLVRSSSDDPDATTFQIETDDVSDDFTVFAFDLETDDNQDDVELFQVILDVDLYNVKDGIVAQNVIHDAALIIDGERMSSNLQFTNRGQLLFFTDLEYYIDADDLVTVEVEVEFESANETEGVAFDISTEQILAVTDDGDGVQITAEGSAKSEEHTLRSEGIITDLVSIDEEIESGFGDRFTQGNFTIKFDVTAFESDVYINPTTRHDGGGSQGNEGFTFNLRNSNFSAGAEGSSIATVKSAADQGRSGRYRIDEGETETFELTVEYTPEKSSFYQMQLFSINYNTVDANPNRHVRPQAAEDFETDFLQIDGEEDGGVVSLLGCEIVTDKKSYLYGDRIRVTWKGVNARTMQFVADNSGKDNIRVPSGTQRTSGSAILAANLYGNPTITMRATAANGDTSDCTVRFQIVQKEEEPTQAVHGVYKVYIDGQLAVTARDATREYATNSCKSGEKDPTKSYRCTWNGIEVYKSEATPEITPSKPQGDSSLPAPISMRYMCNTAGDRMTITWSAPRGFDTFYFRMRDKSDNSNVNWDNNVTATTKIVTVEPGQSYDVWTHVKEEGSGDWGKTASFSGIKCDEPVAEVVVEKSTPAPTAKAQSDSSLPKPAQPMHFCRSGGTRLIMRWDAPNGYENFYFRMRESESKERMNWVSKHPNTSRRVDVEPGVKYDWWVHTHDDATGNWSNHVGEYGISCPGSVLGASISVADVYEELGERLEIIKDRLETSLR